MDVCVCAPNRNRAIHDDVVAVRLLPKSEWRGRGSILPQDGDEVDNRSVCTDVMATGQVVAILERASREYVASFAVSRVKPYCSVLYIENVNNSRKTLSTRVAGVSECWCAHMIYVYQRLGSAQSRLRN